ncbi:MAG: efflux RND transporter periplasmic adaptor subunit [Planctomycetota bacterium]|jgi:putative peptide zinc metalloprotease protein
MAVDRPTFHEAWYRVANLRPRLLPSIHVRKQYYRGQLWYVIENPASDQYCRIGVEAYQFVALLNGQRTVSEAWLICSDHFDGQSLTQGETIQLLGQLHGLNLLHTDLPPDCEILFSRHQKRTRRQVQGYLTNLLFIQIPLVDPDQFLERWAPLVGWIYSWLGLLLWTTLVLAGVGTVLANLEEMVYQSSDVLAPDNLLLLYLGFVTVKIVHEFSHAFACKTYGQLNQAGAQVHRMGVMFLVLFPLPFVDASCAWAFRNKWHRVAVGMAGVMMELAIAAVAAIVWAGTSTGTLHIIAYNIIFAASVSTLLFNGNPLLRFDAYYVLCDVIETPNLSQRSKDYLYYLAKKYCWGIKNAANPAHSLGERVWFVFYGLASTAFRVFICVRILLFLNDRLPEALFVLVPLFASTAIFGWVLVPLGKFVLYLFTSAELARTRSRAILTVVAVVAVLFAILGHVHMPDYERIEGVVEPTEYVALHAGGSGFVVSYLPTGSVASPEGQPIMVARNLEMEVQKEQILAELQVLDIHRRRAMTTEFAQVQLLDEQITALSRQLDKIDSELAALEVKSPSAGTWVSPDIEKMKHAFVHRGQTIGHIVNLNNVLIRATAPQKLAAVLVEQADKTVEMRIKGNPRVHVTGTIDKIFPAGQDLLPSEALGYSAGGSMPTLVRAADAARTAERFFEIQIRPSDSYSPVLYCGQRIVVRARTNPKPLAVQWWHSARQLFQRRFHI